MPVLNEKCFFSVTFNEPSELLYHKARVNESIQNCKSALI